LSELSQFLRRYASEGDVADPKFRGLGSVSYKLGNFAAIDPHNDSMGASHGGAGDRQVWDEFGHDPELTRRTALGIRAHVEGVSKSIVPTEETVDIDEAAEGAVLTVAHRRRERNRSIVNKKKRETLERAGKLECEVCRFDFEQFYGPVGDGFIECHHVIPLSQLEPGSRTKLDDLALVCSNCHRMLHRGPQWQTIDQLRDRVDAARAKT
jgi:5-methylcytosine-specific restriction protein A